jgi:hypothetical protein
MQLEDVFSLNAAALVLCLMLKRDRNDSKWVQKVSTRFVYDSPQTDARPFFTLTVAPITLAINVYTPPSSCLVQAILQRTFRQIYQTVTWQMRGIVPFGYAFVRIG